jgi:hypothetical protein
MVSVSLHSTTGRVTVVLIAAATAVAGCSSDTGSPADETVTVTYTVAGISPAVTIDGSSTAGSDSASPSAPGDSTPASVSASSTQTPPTSTAPASTVATTSKAPVTTSSNRAAKPPVDTSKDKVVWADNSMVSHLYFHSLVIDPKRALSDPESGNGYLDYMVTQSEFATILPQLYDNGYVLVSPHQLATVQTDRRVTPKTLKLPKGRKPLVISVDDVSYYE